MRKEERFSPEELKEVRKKNYEITTDMAIRLQQIKNYITAYSNPQKGIMIVNYMGQNYLIDIEPIETLEKFDDPEKSIHQAMKDYGFLFKDEREAK